MVVVEFAYDCSRLIPIWAAFNHAASGFAPSDLGCRATRFGLRYVAEYINEHHASVPERSGAHRDPCDCYHPFRRQKTARIGPRPRPGHQRIQEERG